MSDNKIKFIIEGLIMAADAPITAEELLKIFHDNKIMLQLSELREVINELGCDYSGRGIELKEVANGYRFQVCPDLADWISKLWEERPPRYSAALLETLALIAYRQPITRAEIEEVRGVGVSTNIIKTLLEQEWVRVIGHKDVPGRPALYVTTKKFLDYFNLKSLEELPPLIQPVPIESVEASVTAAASAVPVESAESSENIASDSVAADSLTSAAPVEEEAVCSEQPIESAIISEDGMSSETIATVASENAIVSSESVEVSDSTAYIDNFAKDTPNTD